MKAAIYCRVSTDNQEAEGTSLDSQLKACQDKAQELGYEINKKYTIRETYSGLSLDRPKLDQLRQWVRDKEVDVVVAYTLDRLSRNPVHFIILQEELERATVRLIMVTETIDSSDMGRLITYIKGFAAKLEAEKIKERTSRGRRMRIASGKLAGGKANYLFGYDYIPGRGEGEGIRRVNEEQAQLVRNIYHWFVEEQLPLDRVVYHLRDLEIPSPSGNPVWHRATIYKMLTNPAYCGIAGKATPAIIDQGSFTKAKERFKRNKELASRNVKRDYLLRGYLYCQYCGRRLHGEFKSYQTKDGTMEYFYYKCSNSSKIYADPCPSRLWRADRLEPLVWQEVKSALANPDLILVGLETLKKEADEANSYLSELKSIEGRISELDKQQEQLLQWALKGFPESTVLQENERINQDRERLKQWKTEVEAKVEECKQAEMDSDSIAKACAMARENIRGFSLEDKRFTLEALKIKILAGDKITIHGVLPIVSTPSIPGRASSSQASARLRSIFCA